MPETRVAQIFFNMSRVYTQAGHGLIVTAEPISSPEHLEGMKTFGQGHLISMNFDSLDSIYLYKTMRYDYVMQIFALSMLRLDKVSSWDDKYENFFLKELFESRGNVVDAKTLIPQTFGQSWTTTKESYAMWKIYSSNHNSVRIKVNARKLLSYLVFDELSTVDTYFGRVAYISERVIHRKMNNLVRQSSFHEVWTSVMPQMCFVKRPEFGYEKEVRIIKQLDSDTTYKYDCDYLQILIDPFDLIEEICFDPELSMWEYELKAEAIRTLGYSKHICHSSLYDFSPKRITLPVV